jgi:Fic family protein
MRGRYERKVWEYDGTIYAPARYRRACSYETFIPDPIDGLEVSLPGDVAGVVSDAEKAVAELNRDAGPELQPLARLLLRTESMASSKVEGLQVETRELARAEAKQETGRAVGPQATEVLANIDAMQLATERAVEIEAVSKKDLRDIHEVLMAQAPNANIAGRFRETQNWIGGNDYNPCGADFVPPPASEVDRLLDDLCRFCNDDTLPPLVQAAIAHAQFEMIHPFGDGNGRTGRALVQILLRRRGLAPMFVPPISVALARNTDQYIEGLTMFREDRIAEWLERFAAATASAAELAVRYAREVAELQERWRATLREHSDPRSDAAAWAIIDVLPAHPIITVPVGVAATGRTKPSITNGIAALEEAGVLTRLSESTRNRAWEADGLLDLIAELESGEWVPAGAS